MTNHMNSEIFELCSYYHQLGFIQRQDFAKNHEVNKELFWKDMIHTSYNDLVYFPSELNKVVSVFDKSNENILWIKIRKNSLNNKSNTYVVCVYNSPKNATYTKEIESNVLQLIEKQLAEFSESNQVIIGGDFNGRIGTMVDFIVQDIKDLDFLPEGYELDTFTTQRNNEDVSLNSYGEQLIQLCIA